MIPLNINWGNPYVSVSIQRSTTSTWSRIVHVDRASLFGSNIPN